MFTDSQTGDTQIITYPNTPISAKDSHSANVEEFQGDFARLIPANRLARIAYSEVIEKSLRLPQWNEHAQKFLYFEEARDDEDHLSELSDADTTAVLARQRCRWSGYYRLNLSILPQYIGLGWILGSGSVSFPEAGVDLLLTAERSQHRIGSRHTRFSFHRGTGCLLVFADRRNVSLRGSFGQVELRNAHRALTESAGITIGDLQYSFEYTGLNQERYREELTSLMKQKLGQPEFEISSSLSTSGSDTDIQLKDYTVKQVFASGISCTVATAIVKKTGEAVAVKKLKKSDTNYDAVMCEVNILQRIEQHVSIPSS